MNKINVWSIYIVVTALSDRFKNGSSLLIVLCYKTRCCSERIIVIFGAPPGQASKASVALRSLFRMLFVFFTPLRVIPTRADLIVFASDRNAIYKATTRLCNGVFVFRLLPILTLFRAVCNENWQ